MTRHGHRGKTNRKRSPTYLSWAGMKQRCLNPNHAKYWNYGGRGITIDPRWMEFEAFLEDMGTRPRGKTLDRKDANGPYCKENCKWSTNRQQRRNQRRWIEAREGRAA